MHILRRDRQWRSKWVPNFQPNSTRWNILNEVIPQRLPTAVNWFEYQSWQGTQNVFIFIGYPPYQIRLFWRRGAWGYLARTWNPSDLLTKFSGMGIDPRNSLYGDASVYSLLLYVADRRHCSDTPCALQCWYARNSALFSGQRIDWYAILITECVTETIR